MSYKQFFKYNLIDLLALVIAIMFSLYTAVYLNRSVGLIELTIIVVVTVAIIVTRVISYRRILRLVSKIAATLDPRKKKSINDFPLPVAVANQRGKIEWYNELFVNEVLQGGRFYGNDIMQFTSNIDVLTLSSQKHTDVAYKNKRYTIFTQTVDNKNEKLSVIYFFEDTQMKETVFKYKQSRPNVMLISVDGIDELPQGYKEGERAEIRSGVEKMIEDWVTDYLCLLRKLSSDRFIIVSEEQHLSQMISKRFDILDIVRKYTYMDRPIGVTLSIGVGRGESFSECEGNARQALDMALGRGGDQAAVKGKDMSYEFFGGISKSVEKKTKVKARIVATAISELVKTGGDVYIMGHHFSDLDALGSATALCLAFRSMGKTSHIVIDNQKTLAGTLVQRLRHENLGNVLIEPKIALEKMDENSILFIVDTHISDFTESKKVYEKAGSVIVIDHHRLVVDHITNAVIFYHDPSASSTAEMVTELLQYMSSKPLIEKTGADALLAGIMLDTKNFILRAGVRTFEAAAYLKSLGADTVKVKSLFASSLESFRLRNNVIVSAETFCNCAIAVADFDSHDIRIICAQAADEMLNIDGVEASFVVFESKGQINISARSFGTVNVQIIMEVFGGGGHQTMAAAQINSDETDIEAVIAKLRVAISNSFSG